MAWGSRPSRCLPQEVIPTDVFDLEAVVPPHFQTPVRVQETSDLPVGPLTGHTHSSGWLGAARLACPTTAIKSLVSVLS
jgi:hypothetical protein